MKVTKQPSKPAIRTRVFLTPRAPKVTRAAIETGHLPHYPGVYKLVNLITGEFYIGGCTNISSRAYDHTLMLGKGEHHCYRLQRSFDQHGASAFAFEVVERTGRPEAFDRERHWIDTLRPHFNSETNEQMRELPLRIEAMSNDELSQLRKCLWYLRESRIPSDRKLIAIEAADLIARAGMPVDHGHATPLPLRSTFVQDDELCA